MRHFRRGKFSIIKMARVFSDLNLVYKIAFLCYIELFYLVAKSGSDY